MVDTTAPAEIGIRSHPAKTEPVRGAIDIKLPPAPETLPTSPLTPADIRYGYQIGVIHQVVKSLDGTTRPLGVEHVKTLFSRMVYVHNYNQVNQYDQLREHFVPSWPEDSKKTDVFAKAQVTDWTETDPVLYPEPPFIFGSPTPRKSVTVTHVQEEASWTEKEEYPSYYVVKPGISKTFPEGIEDYPDEDIDPLRRVTVAALLALPKEQQQEALQWIFKIASKVYIQAEDIQDVVNFMVNSPAKEVLYTDFMHYLYDNRENYNYNDESRKSPWENPIVANMTSFVEELTFLYHENLLKAFVDLEDNKARTLLGMVVFTSFYGDILNITRKFLEESAPDEKPKIERLGRMLLGFDPDDPRPFHATLNDVYAAIHFEEYVTNQAAQARELGLIKTHITKDGIVADMGSGTGRTSNELAKDGYKVIALDTSKENLATARATDITHSVQYQEGNLQKTGLEDNKVTTAISIGRTLTHAEQREIFIKILNEMHRVIKEGGTFLFDMPDPNKGAYLRNRQKLAEIFRKLDIPQSLMDTQMAVNVDLIVDSPDGTNFYNRYTPQLEDVKAMVERTGFSEVEEIERAPIEGPLWEGSENVYFKAKNGPKTPLPSIPNQTTPSLSGQSQDE